MIIDMIDSAAGSRRPSRIHRAVTFLLGNRASRIYLLAVLGAALFMLLESAVSAGPSFSGIALVLATAPLSPAIPIVLLSPVASDLPEWMTTAVVFGGLLGGALLNTFLISTVARHLGRARETRLARG